MALAVHSLAINYLWRAGGGGTLKWRDGFARLRFWEMISGYSIEYQQRN